MSRTLSWLRVAAAIAFTALIVAAAIAYAARNSSGTYSLPTGNPVVSGTTISTTWANTTLADLGSEVTDSLSRSGKGPMLAPLVMNASASAASPDLTWTGDTGTGFYRVGAGDIGVSIAGTKISDWQSGGLTISLGGTAAATPANFFTPSLANGNTLTMLLGKAASNNNSAGLQYIPNATAANSVGCMAVFGQTQTLCVDGNGKTLISGGVTSSSGVKHQRLTGGLCSTLASIGSTCTTTLTWTVAFADANYSVTCTASGTSQGIPILKEENNKIAASIQVQTVALTNAVAQFSGVDCIAIHD